MVRLGVGASCALAGIALAAGSIGTATDAAASCAVEPYIGGICFTAVEYCPEDYLPADGRSLLINQYQALYALIGIRYGSSNASNFNLPDLRARSAVGTGQGPAIDAVALAQQMGAPATVLTPTQVPLVAHTHTAVFIGTGGGGSGPLVASGSVAIPLDGSVSGLPFSANANLSVSGSAMIGSSTTTGRTQTLGNASVLTSVGGPSAQIYAPAGTSNDRQVGPSNGVTGSAQGTVSGTASGGTLTGSATGPVSLPVTGATGITGGTVTVAPVGAPASAQLNLRDPGLGLTACIAVLGIYPTRP